MKRWSHLLVLLAGCAAPYEVTVASTDEPRADVDSYDARITELRRDLDAALPAEAGPDELGQPRGELPIQVSSQCLVAADLRDRMCDLSERICAIAASEPEASEVQPKCARSRGLCADARSRVASACGEL